MIVPLEGRLPDVGGAAARAVGEVAGVGDVTTVALVGVPAETVAIGPEVVWVAELGWAFAAVVPLVNTVADVTVTEPETVVGEVGPSTVVMPALPSRSGLRGLRLERSEGSCLLP
jgi:hypothetical protein